MDIEIVKIFSRIDESGHTDEFVFTKNVNVSMVKTYLNNDPAALGSNLTVSRSQENCVSKCNPY